MRNWMSDAWAGVRLWAAVKLTPVPIPKVLNKQASLPSYLKTATPNPETVLPQSDRRLANTNIEDYRGGANSRAIIRDFVAASPDLAASVFAYVRTAITSRYTAVAKNMDGTFSREATSLLQQLLTRFDVVQDYEDGFSGVNSMRSNSESLSREILVYGACSLELVLGKDRLPRTLQPVSVFQVSFRPDKSGKWLRPFQKISGAEIDLDQPTFFYTALDQDLLEPYASSPLEPSIQTVQFAAEFMNDLRRIVKRVVHPRMGVKIDEEKFRKNIPESAKKDEASLVAYMESMISSLESKVNGLNPEDALVYFDMIGVELMNNGNVSLSDEYTVLAGIIDAKMTTGAKALPSILGHGSGSQNIASSETLLFMKNVQGAVQEKLNEIYSRALTLALRLFGQDVYAEFRYDPIDLRPEAELEAFKVMRQERYLSLLSLGFITDDEASMRLTGQLTPAGFAPLMGTGFHTMKPVDPNANPYNGTSTGSGGGASNQAVKSDAPKKPKGK